MKKVYLVAEVDVKTDSIIESTIKVFSSRSKQIQHINQLKLTIGFISGLRCIDARSEYVL